MLTATELAQLRQDVLETLPDTCRIERATITNTNGNVSETWGTAVASAVCRLDPDNRRQEDAVLADRESGVARYLLSLAYDTDIRDGDRVVVNGRTYQASQIHENHTMRAVRRVRLTAVRTES